MAPSKGKPAGYSVVREHIRVTLSGMTTDRCVTYWPYAKTADRPQVRYNGKKIHAVRFAFQLLHGREMNDWCLHRCENKRCWNPHHVYEGNRQGNAEDAVKSGRVKHGRRHHSAKLSPDSVRSIRRRYAAGVMGKDLAAEHGVSKATVSHVVNGHRWKRVRTA
jgi:hypothetical protein